MPDPDHVKRLAGRVPACSSGRHIRHPDMDCQQLDDEWAALEVAFAAAFGDLLRTPMADVPPALRGPNWKA